MNTSETPPDSPQQPELSAVVIPLLKGIVYQENDPQLWAQLLALDSRIRDYVSILGLELILDEAEGYAFLLSREPDENDPESRATTATPRLFARRQLSFPISLLLALLRKKLVEFDASGAEARLVLSRDEIIEITRVFLPTHNNEARLTDKIETHLNQINKLGFIRKLKTRSTSAPAHYEVRRIIKAFIDAQWLAEFDARLDAYRQHLESEISKQNDSDISPESAETPPL